MPESHTSFLLYDAPGLPSPRRVRICLLEKNLSFTSRWLNVGLMDQKAPAYLRLNPTGMVPTLVHGERVVYDSNVINEYLDALFPEPGLVPKDPYELAQMRMWFAFETDYAKPFRDATYETLGKRRLKASGRTAEMLEAEIASRTTNPFYRKLARSLFASDTDHTVIADRLLLIFEKMDGLERALADGREWLCGGNFTLADIAVAPRLEMFPMIGVDDLAQRYPKIHAWMARVKNRPSWAGSDIVPAAGEAETRVDCVAVARSNASKSPPTKA
jgi:glutathione S-transferase